MEKYQKAILVAAMLCFSATAAKADVFEVVSAPIADGITAAQVSAADAPVGEFVSKLPGFIKRETGISVKEDGMSPGNEWFVIVRWDTIEHAQQAAKLLMPTQQSAGLMKVLKSQQLFFRHYTIN